MLSHIQPFALGVSSEWGLWTIVITAAPSREIPADYYVYTDTWTTFIMPWGSVFNQDICMVSLYPDLDKPATEFYF